jgi:hypothetical protein
MWELQIESYSTDARVLKSAAGWLRSNAGTGEVPTSTESRYPTRVMQRLTLRYRTGEEIRKGDRVRFHGNPAAVELVSFDPSDPNPEVVWHMKELGGGVLISDPMVSGRTFIPHDQLDEYEDLEFVSREQG